MKVAHVFALAAAMLCTSAAQALADQLDHKKLDAAVKACVAAIHARVGVSWPVPPDWFDAYYNPATGLVEHNATLQVQLPIIFAFRKCMTQKGFPLGAERDVTPR